MLVVMVNGRGYRGRRTTNRISDNCRNGNATLSRIQVVDLYALALAKTYPISYLPAIPLLGRGGRPRNHQRTTAPRFSSTSEIPAIFRGHSSDYRAI